MAKMNVVCCTAPARHAFRVDPQRAPDGALSAAQQETVQALRHLIEQDLPTWEEDARSEAEAHMDDFTLLRFCIARPDSTDAALLMFRNACIWRAQKGINCLFCELHAKAEPTARQRAVRAYSVGGYGGLDRSGLPYFILRVGRADLAGFCRHPQLHELMMDAAAVNMEQIFRSARHCSAARGTFERCLLVLDADGLSLATVRHVGTIKPLLSFGPEYFPEGASKVLIINAPRIFAGVWALISPLLPKRSRDKVSILSAASSLPALLDYIHPAELPRFLGGELPEDQCLVPRAEQVPEDVAIAFEVSSLMT